MKNRYLIAFIVVVISVVVIIFALRSTSPNNDEGTVPSPLPTSTSATPSPSSTPLTYKDLIRVDEPVNGAHVTAPLKISGMARGQWFFEATFPVVLTSVDGTNIAEGYATADGEWMTESYVPFTAELHYVKSTNSDRGILILRKSNPSGLLERDDEVKIPVYFN